MIARGKMLVGSADDLMPTEDSIRQIASNKSLLAGFDDPEVMRAVHDVGQNPANIHKYKSNQKVMTSGHLCAQQGSQQDAQGSCNAFMQKSLGPFQCRLNVSECK